MAIPASAKALFAKYKPEQIREMLADIEKEELKEKAAAMIKALDAAYKTLGEEFPQALANWINEKNLATTLKGLLKVDPNIRLKWVRSYFEANADEDGKVRGTDFLAAHKAAWGNSVIGYLMRGDKSVLVKDGDSYKLADDADAEG